MMMSMGLRAAPDGAALGVAKADMADNSAVPETVNLAALATRTGKSRWKMALIVMGPHVDPEIIGHA